MSNFKDRGNPEDWAIGPEEAMRSATISPAMIGAINQLLRLKLKQGVARFGQHELHQCVTGAGVPLADINAHGWFETFVDVYRGKGWNVEVHQPDHSDYPEKTYVFTAKNAS